MAIDTSAQTVIHSVASDAKSLHLNRAEERVVRAMRDAGKRGKAWMLVLCGNSAGVRIHPTLPPEWEPKQ